MHQFTYNPEWFEEEDEEEEEEWDIQKFRKEQQDEIDAEEKSHAGALQDGYREPPAAHSDSSDDGKGTESDEGENT